ncbi:OB-fold protein [Enterobacter vonholyi]
MVAILLVRLPAVAIIDNMSKIRVNVVRPSKWNGIHRMALIDCNECGNKISDKAVACPHCGAPLGSDAEHYTNHRVKHPAPDDEETFSGRFFTYIKILAKCGFLLFIVFYVVPFFFSGNSDPINQVGSSSSGPAIRPDTTNMTLFTAQEITDSYERNTVSADQQFKGKWILMEGVVTNISTDISNDAYVTLDTTNSFYSPRAKFIREENDKLASLIKGQHIVMLCIGDGDTLKAPMLKDCTLVN